MNSEIYRAKNTESILTTNLDLEINRAKAKESSIDTELANRYTKDKVYTKDEVLQKISELINNAPNVLDTFKEIADALGNDPNFATTMTTMLAGKVDKVSGKGLSTNDYTDTEKANLADTNNKKHEHGNKSVIDGITATLIGYWNAAYTHISDSVKHITSDERTLWNTVSNKVDKITGKSLSTNDFDNNYKGKIDGISSNANKVEVSTTNGNIKIDGAEKTVYTHPSGTNPHGTTKSDVGLGNVTNDPQVKRSEMGAASGVATLDSSGVNSQAPKLHTHDDRYYTESEANAKFATKDEISNSGYGDMLKSAYDTNNDGVVDKAEKLATARKINGFAFDGASDINLTPESLGANKWTSMYKHAEGSGITNYSKIFSITITGTYADVAECFIISCRSNKIALVMVTASCGNDYKIANVKVDVFPLTTNGMVIVNYFRAGTISISSTVDGIELWMKISSWDECQIYPQTTMRRQYNINYYNGTVTTAFPTYFTSYVDSQLVAIKASSIKGIVQWNDLKGV